MKVQVNMINVENGDAIIVELFENENSAVILIDGGRKGYYHSRLQPTLARILAEHEKEGPDLVVCTHYDQDHIEGIINVLDEYQNKVRRVWVHQHPADLKEQIKLAKVVLEGKVPPLDFLERKEFTKAQEVLGLLEKSEFDIEELNLVIESIIDLETLYEMIARINKGCRENGLEEIIVEHPVKGHQLENWPQFIVEGPTREYLEDCFKNFKNTKAFLLEESQKDIQLNRELLLANYELQEGRPSPCEELAVSSRISATNRSSIICSVEGELGKYLFTGDAGIKSFSSIPNWETQLEGLFWLDVPHHGSWNNTSKRMIEVFKPKFAFVSGEAEDNRPHWAIKACLEEKGASVEVTNDPKNTIVLGIDTKGKTYRK